MPVDEESNEIERPKLTSLLVANADEQNKQESLEFPWLDRITSPSLHLNTVDPRSDLETSEQADRQRRLGSSRDVLPSASFFSSLLDLYELLEPIDRLFV